MNKKCTKQLHVDVSLFHGVMFHRFRQYLNELDVCGIYPDYKTNEKMMDMLDDYYIQPYWSALTKLLSKETQHNVHIGGNGQSLRFDYTDTDAAFMFEVIEYGSADVDVYYNNKADDMMCIDFIEALQHVMNTQRFFDLSAEIKEYKQKQKAWLDEIYANQSDDDIDDIIDEDELWNEYIDSVKDGFEEWKQKRNHKQKQKGPDTNAGTILYNNGQQWVQLDGITDFEISTDDTASFYADDEKYYNLPLTYEFSFTCETISEAMNDLVQAAADAIKKLGNSSTPP